MVGGDMATTSPEKIILECVPDDALGDADHRSLIALLHLSFPRKGLFENQRFHRELPKFRYLYRREGAILAHLAFHEKLFLSGVRSFRYGGIAEVAVHPDLRGRGMARTMLDRAHGDMIQMGLKYSLLFGNPEVYGSSGYNALGECAQLLRDGEGELTEIPIRPLGLCLTAETFPSGKLLFPGLMF